MLGIALTGATAAAAKPSIAVLGLEVVDPSGAPTPADTAVAEALTKALRDRANTPTGTYQYTPRSEKELVDEKVLNNCNTEGLGCMSTIGKQLGADMLMYGHIERERNGSSYVVTVTLLDITTGKKSGPFSDKLAVGASDPQLELEAKKLYSRLTGDTGAGTIDVQLQGADRGTIYLDGEPRGTITSGTGEVTGVSEGSHHISVEVGGFRRWERDVSVTAGETTDVSVDNLERTGGGSESTSTSSGTDGSSTTGTSGLGVGATVQTGHSNSTLKIVGYSGVGVGAVAGAVLIWAYADLNSKYDNKVMDPHFSNDSCGDPNSVLPVNRSAFSLACRDHDITLVAGITSGVAGVVGISALIWAYTHNGGHEQSRQVAGHRESNKPRFTITPIMSPQGGGMTFRMDW